MQIEYELVSHGDSWEAYARFDTKDGQTFCMRAIAPTSKQAIRGVMREIEKKLVKEQSN